jgi:hypothetical protein
MKAKYYKFVTNESEKSNFIKKLLREYNGNCIKCFFMLKINPNLSPSLAAFPRY